jgi:hypothetical protein
VNGFQAVLSFDQFLWRASSLIVGKIQFVSLVLLSHFVDGVFFQNLPLVRETHLASHNSRKRA